MLQILLSVLKVIGIILAILIALILLLLLLILFVPIRYDVSASKHEAVEAKVNVSWLLHFLDAKLTFGKEKLMRVKVCGITVYSDKNKDKDDKSSKKEKKSKDKRSKDKKSKDKKSSETMPSEEKKKSSDAAADSSEAEKEKTEFELERAKLKEKYQKAVSYNYDDKEEPKKKFDLKKKIKDLKKKLRNIKKRITDTKTSIHDKITYACDMIHDPANKNALKLLWDSLKRLVIHILPRKNKIDVTYGNSQNPATTADVVGYAAVAKSVTGLNIKLTPAFDEDIIEADVRLKGRLMLILVLIIAIKLLLNKDVKKFLDNFS